MCFSFMLEPLGGDVKVEFRGEVSGGENSWDKLGDCWGGCESGGALTRSSIGLLPMCEFCCCFWHECCCVPGDTLWTEPALLAEPGEACNFGDGRGVVDADGGRRLCGLLCGG